MVATFHSKHPFAPPVKKKMDHMTYSVPISNIVTSIPDDSGMNPSVEKSFLHTRNAIVEFVEEGFIEL